MEVKPWDVRLHSECKLKETTGNRLLKLSVWKVLRDQRKINYFMITDHHLGGDIPHMRSLVVLAFGDEDTAAEVRDELFEMQKQELITLEDAAVVVRRDDGKVKVKQAQSLVGAGALGGAFWGMLIGLIFLAPVLGMAVGAVTGALGGKYTDIGIDDDFIKEVGDTVEPGTSALFLMVTQVQRDRVVEELKQYDPELLQTNLSTEEEEKLREAFAADEVAV